MCVYVSVDACVSVDVCVSLDVCVLCTGVHIHVRLAFSDLPSLAARVSLWGFCSKVEPHVLHSASIKPPHFALSDTLYALW